MPYTALPDRRMPYDNDGTVVCYRYGNTPPNFTDGIQGYTSGPDALELQDYDRVGIYAVSTTGSVAAIMLWLFFPETREVTGAMLGVEGTATGLNTNAFQGSSDSTNGVDGTWETASLPAGDPARITTFDSWRSSVKAISFTGPKQVIRFRLVNTSANTNWSISTVHLYGEKAAGQTPDDVIYINHDDTPGVEFAAPEDFGDQPLGTTVVRQWRLKNTSASKTANSINIQCNDADAAISSDGSTWVTTINIASLAAGAESSTMYVRWTTPAAGGALGPRFSRIVTTVASYT